MRPVAYCLRGLAYRPCLCGPGQWAMPMWPCVLLTRVRPSGARADACFYCAGPHRRPSAQAYLSAGSGRLCGIAVIPQNPPAAVEFDCRFPANGKPACHCGQGLLLAKAHLKIRLPGKRPSMCDRTSDCCFLLTSNAGDSCIEMPRLG